MFNRLACLAIVALISVIAAGCGGGDGSSTTSSTTTAAGVTGASGVGGALTTSALSKDQWIQAADNVCQQTDQAIAQQAQQTLGQSPSQAQLAKFATDTVIPQTQSMLSQLQALGAPAGDEQQVQAILAAGQQGLDKIKQDPALATEKNAGGTFDEADQLAQAYGLQVCGQG